jgi:succinate dehydrogenase / fumarate reductase, membrane anchor subunit
VVRREVVGAHYGLFDWLVQRLSAVVMVAYTLLLLLVLARMPQLDYPHWKALWNVPMMRYCTALFLLALYLHAWVGLRDIFMDYIKDAGLRLTLYMFTVIALVWYAIWSVQILWGL